MPAAYGAEFRQDVIDVARKGEAPLTQIAKDYNDLGYAGMPRPAP